MLVFIELEPLVFVEFALLVYFAKIAILFDIDSETDEKKPLRRFMANFRGVNSIF